MSYKVSLAALAITLLAACERSAPPPVDLAAEAQRITRESIIVDTHIDVPYRLTESPDNVSEATEGGDFDYPRARRRTRCRVHVDLHVCRAGGGRQIPRCSRTTH